jgi:hypothetical protein
MISFCLTESNLKVGQLVLHLQALEIQQLSAQFLLQHIPSSFARTFLNTVTGFVTLQVSDGKQWPVRCSFKDGKAKLGQGWTEFVWENNLEEGDVCIFELIHAKEIVLKVAVFRVLEDAAPTGQLSN